jgi:hypothetical protein
MRLYLNTKSISFLIGHVGKMSFFFCKTIVWEHIHAILAKTMKMYVLPTLGGCATTTITFDLWMFRISP